MALGQAKFDQANPHQYPHTVARKSAMRLRPRYVRGTAPASSTTTFRSTRDLLRARAAGWLGKLRARQTEENAVAKGKRTFQPNNRRRARVHGFRLRMRTRAGRAIVSGRRRKGRRALSA